MYRHTHFNKYIPTITPNYEHLVVPLLSNYTYINTYSTLCQYKAYFVTEGTLRNKHRCYSWGPPQPPSPDDTFHILLLSWRWQLVRFMNNNKQNYNSINTIKINLFLFSLGSTIWE